MLLALALRRVTLIGMVAAPGAGACRLVALRRVTLHGTVVVVVVRRRVVHSRGTAAPQVVAYPQVALVAADMVAPAVVAP